MSNLECIRVQQQCNLGKEVHLRIKQKRRLVNKSLPGCEIANHIKKKNLTMHKICLARTVMYKTKNRGTHTLKQTSVKENN
jgi:hypothetical protein